MDGTSLIFCRSVLGRHCLESSYAGVLCGWKRVPFLYPKLKKAYAEIASDIVGDDKQRRKNYLIKPVIPETIIAIIKRHYEKTGHMIEPDNKTKG